MADNPDARPKEQPTTPQVKDADIVAIPDVPHAPFIFFEMTPALGHTNGIINLTLSANRVTVGPNGVINEQVVVAYLRGNIQAALSLRRAIDDALLLAAPAGEGKAN